jgi:hypothetical protein
MKELDYEDWNDLIARKFFNKEMAGKEVLLFVTKDVLNQLGTEAGKNFEDFIRCVKEGPSCTTRQFICQKALQCYEDWRGTRQGYPQYIAYLALFVLAATVGGDFDPKAYYPRLRQLLGEPLKTGAYPSFEKMDNLWNDLEKWSRVYKHEELGRFSKRIRGGKIHVGLPFSQTILSEDERKALPQIFIDAEIDPTDPPSESSLRRLILRYGSDKLENRTFQLLKNKDSDILEIRDVLMDFILGEISEWDGSAVEIPRVAVPRQPSVGLRICFDPPDRAARKILFFLRFKTNQPFPEGGLNFEHGERIYSCFETAPNWSTKLKDHETGIFLNATELDWIKGTKFEDKEKGWRANLKAAPVRLFLSGSRENLSGWIESQRLERDRSFIIACHTSKLAIVEDWGTKYCKKFTAPSFDGLPSDWQLFEGEGPQEPCREIDVLNLPTLLRLRLQGGIKVGRGNSYLKFAPPKILLDGAQGDEYIIINFNQCKFPLQKRDPTESMWSIPEDVPVREPLELVVSRNENENLARRVVQLLEPVISDKLEETPKRDRFGSIIPSNASGPYARGAIASGDSLLEYGSFPQVLPTHLSKRIIFLGSRPGQIADWPEDNLPSSWNPVWAIAKVPRAGSEKWKVHFCGQFDQAIADLAPSTPLEDYRFIKKWRQTIKTSRTRIKEPDLKVPKKLWAKYKEAATNV